MNRNKRPGASSAKPAARHGKSRAKAATDGDAVSPDAPVGDAKEAWLESLPESARWNPIPDSSGQRRPEVPSDDDDNDDGRNESAQLVEEGVMGAEDDQARQAQRQAAELDGSEPQRIVRRAGARPGGGRGPGGRGGSHRAA